MSEADRLKWDGRYASDAYRMGDGPKAFLRLLQREGLLPRPGGRALDLAAGEGQTAVFLAQQGFEVDAWDVSPVGLRKADRLAHTAGCGARVHTRAVDLEHLTRADVASPLGRAHYDLVTCVHYKQADLAPAIVEALKPGGRVAIEILGVANLEAHTHPSRRFLVTDDEVAGWFAELRPVWQQTGWEEGRYVVRYAGER